MFEAKVKEPVRIITKASNEWLEFQYQKHIRNRNTTATNPEQSTKSCSFKAKKETCTVGYGIAAKDGG